jgi:hypothetical protein
MYRDSTAREYRANLTQGRETNAEYSSGGDPYIKHWNNNWRVVGGDSMGQTHY